jgi:hypothetical protein
MTFRQKTIAWLVARLAMQKPSLSAPYGRASLMNTLVKPKPARS